MSPRPSTLRALAYGAYAICAISVACVIALLVLINSDSEYTPSESLARSVPDMLMVVAFIVVGLVVTLKRRSNLVGWALLLAGGGLLVGGVLEAYGELALLAKPEAGLPAGTAAAALGAGSWTALMAGVFLLMLVFPSGTISSPAVSRFAILVLLGFAAVWALIAMGPGRLDPPFEAYENPLAFTTSPAYTVVTVATWVPCLVSVVIAAIVAVRRSRRARGQERQQFKWLAASAGLLVVTLPLAVEFGFAGVGGAVFLVPLIALPVSVGIAVLRYRLYEIDLIIRRTLVYSTLSALLAGTYVAIVIGLQAVFSSFAGGSNLAIAVSTLVVAALFLPVRSRVQGFVDRRFYRRRYDAQRTLAAFAARLREQVELETLTAELRGVVEETMQPAHVSLWRRAEGGGR